METASQSVTPRVSIGLPVYNGENYLEAAIQSILDQSYGNFELIICDNASEDRTRELCESAVNNDERIKYHRNPENLGAAANFDLCFEKATGKYFKWAAHDDLLEPDYLEKTVSALEANPEAIKCVTAIREIDANGETTRTYDLNHLGGLEDRPSKRFARIIKEWHNCNDFFGVYVRKSLVGSQLHGNFIESDRVLLAEMALRGKTIRLDEPLFIHREHEERFSIKMYFDRANAADWWVADKAQAKRFQLFHWTIYFNYFKVVRKNMNRLGDRWKCYGHLFHWFFLRKHFKHLMADLVWKINPKIYAKFVHRERKNYKGPELASKQVKQ